MNNFRSYFYLGGAVLLLMFSIRLGSAQTTPPADPNIIAHIGSDPIKVEEVRSALAKLDARQQAALAGNPKLLDQTVESIVIQRLIYGQAIAQKWDQQPDAVAQLERVRTAAISEGFLASVSKPPADFPSEDMIKAAYDYNKAKMIMPRQFRLAQIYVAIPKGADAAAMAQAQGKLDAVRQTLGQQGADFSACAKASSDDRQTGARGGEIGWVAENQIEPELRSHVVTLGKNATSAPIKLGDGWHILKVIDIKDSYTATLPEVRDQIVQQLRAQKTQALQQAYVAKLLQEHPITLNPSALAQILPLSSAGK